MQRVVQAAVYRGVDVIMPAYCVCASNLDITGAGADRMCQQHAWLMSCWWHRAHLVIGELVTDDTCMLAGMSMAVRGPGLSLVIMICKSGD